MIGNDLSLRQHVSYTSKTCRFHLRNISRIRKYIPRDTSVVLDKSLVMSRLDYSNGLFYGLPKCTVSGLQAVQNSAARIVTQERLRDHDSMSRALIGLHWLPVDKSFARASANLWNSLRGERAACFKNSPTLESFKRNLKTFFFWERFSS